jgi:EAL domain-containing protein (putative c-di-GMP-specific phosphodiesterase class I)
MDTIFMDPERVASAPRAGCAGCRDSRFDTTIAMAFQPIVSAEGRVFAFEALVRGANGESAGEILSQVNRHNLYAFDQLCRTTAIETAARLGLGNSGAMLSINFSPHAIYEPTRCMQTSLAAARRAGLPNEAIMFEITENEKLHDPHHLRDIVTAYRGMGFKVAIDDFGAGYSNLDLLAGFQPDIIKLDMALTRGIDADPVRRAILRSMIGLCDALSITLVAEGIECAAEYRTLRDLGVGLFQGYLFARPEIGVLPVPVMPPG